MPTGSLVRNSKGIGSKGDLFSTNLFPTDVSRGVHTFEVLGPKLKRFGGTNLDKKLPDPGLIQKSQGICMI